MPSLQPQERDLVSKLLVYESGDRLSAEQVSLLRFDVCFVCVLSVNADWNCRVCNMDISTTDNVHRGQTKNIKNKSGRWLYRKLT
jgi:hypothetical protein